jgi:hypothetical protein
LQNETTVKIMPERFHCCNGVQLATRLPGLPDGPGLPDDPSEWSGSLSPSRLGSLAPTFKTGDGGRGRFALARRVGRSQNDGLSGRLDVVKE